VLNGLYAAFDGFPVENIQTENENGKAHPEKHDPGMRLSLPAS
jgi:hypothetical protein